MSRPAAFDHDVRPCYGGRRIRAQKHGSPGNLLNRHKLLGRLRGEQHVALDLSSVMPRGFRGVRDLLLDKRSQDVAGADCIDGDAASATSSAMVLVNP